MDRRMQARCLQLILSNIFIYGWYLRSHTVDEFFETLGRFMDEKLGIAGTWWTGISVTETPAGLPGWSKRAARKKRVPRKVDCRGCLVKRVFPEH